MSKRPVTVAANLQQQFVPPPGPYAAKVTKDAKPPRKAKGPTGDAPIAYYFVLIVLIFTAALALNLRLRATRRRPPALDWNATAVEALSRPLPPRAQITKLLAGAGGSSSSLEECESTVVTAYFRVRSKHTENEYDGWMANFLSIKDCMVVFTSKDVAPQIERFRRGHSKDRTVIVEMTIDDLPIRDIYGPSFWPYQLEIDREWRIHQSYELFWIWLSKSWLVRRTMDENWFRSSFFVWVDIGSFRDGRYNGKGIVRYPSVVPEGTVLWMAHSPPNMPPTGPLWDDKFGGSFFFRRKSRYFFHSGSLAAGGARAWQDFHDAFARMVDRFVAASLFIGEDQCVLQGTCQANPSLCAYLPHTEVEDDSYFGLRYALHHGGEYRIWRPPPAVTSLSHESTYYEDMSGRG